jgi:hypothetical protein
MECETRQDIWAQYGQVSRSRAQDCEGIRMAQGRFLGDMLDILLRCFSDCCFSLSSAQAPYGKSSALSGSSRGGSSWGSPPWCSTIPR